jgi:hypothetical protein
MPTKIFLRSVLLLAVTVLGFNFAGCARLLPPRTAEASSYELVLDTRRLPVETLSGCFIPAIFPAVTKLPVFFVQKIPDSAKFTSVRCEVLLKEGEMKVLEPVIDDNRVYLKMAVPTAESFSSYHVVVYAKYEYRR